MMTTATSSSHIKPFRIVMSPLPGFSFALGWIGVLMPDAFDFDQKKNGPVGETNCVDQLTKNPRNVMT
jgi:hypothetical protein